MNKERLWIRTLQSIQVVLLCIAIPMVSTLHGSVVKGEVGDRRSETSVMEDDIKEDVIFEDTSVSEEVLVEPSTELEVEVDVEPEPLVVEKVYFNVPLSEDLQDYIFELCEKNSIDPTIVVAMIFRESSFRASIVGDKGKSFGLMQIQPKWNQERMDRLNCQNLLDPYQNVTVGIDLISELNEKGKSIEWVLMAYNGGQSYANKKVAKGEVSSYASKILADCVKLKNGEKLK